MRRCAKLAAQREAAGAHAFAQMKLFLAVSVGVVVAHCAPSVSATSTIARIPSEFRFRD
jgi:hypothetical protein